MTDERAIPCQCDPPGSGEEFCTGHCFLRAELDQLRLLIAVKDRLIESDTEERNNVRLRTAQQLEELRAELEALRARWEEAGKNTVDVLSDVLGLIHAADKTYGDSRLEFADERICELLDRWTGWCSPQNSFESADQRTQTIILRTAAEIMRARGGHGDIHTAIALLEAVNAG